MTKIKTLEALGFVPAFKGSQGGMLKERIEEQDAKSLAAEHGGTATPAPIQYVVGLGRFCPRQRRGGLRLTNSGAQVSTAPHCGRFSFFLRPIAGAFHI